MRNAAPPPASVSLQRVWFVPRRDAADSETHAGRPPSHWSVLSTLPGRQSMSKELVISANRHETRVAILEDDQVVEVYHQRENEYSLAGSIHKGRVTRVLPGMQSAFVDIGLDRDAFLYVRTSSRTTKSTTRSSPAWRRRSSSWTALAGSCAAAGGSGRASGAPRSKSRRSRGGAAEPVEAARRGCAQLRAAVAGRSGFGRAGRPGPPRAPSAPPARPEGRRGLPDSKFYSPRRRPRCRAAPRGARPEPARAAT